MPILGCLAATIILAPLSWRKGWKWKSLWPAFFLFVIAVIDAAVGYKFSDISVFDVIVGIIFVLWSAYMVLIPPKPTKNKK